MFEHYQSALICLSLKMVSKICELMVDDVSNRCHVLTFCQLTARPIIWMGIIFSEQGYVVSDLICAERRVKFLLPSQDLTVEVDIKYMWFHNAVGLIFFSPGLLTSFHYDM